MRNKVFIASLILQQGSMCRAFPCSRHKNRVGKSSRGVPFNWRWESGGPQPDATYVASVILYKLPDVDSEAQFLKLISERRLSEPDTGRFRIVKNAEEISHRSEVYCVKYHTISEDHAARTSSGVGSMLSEMMGYHCQHPKNKNVGVNFQYSHRHYPGDEDPLIGKKAAEFLEDVKFIAF